MKHYMTKISGVLWAQYLKGDWWLKADLCFFHALIGGGCNQVDLSP
jgi:hypothetical protein